MTFLILESQSLRYVVLTVMAVESLGFWLYIRENKILRNLLHQYLLSIHKNTTIIMNNEEQAQADITAILNAVTSGATAVTGIAQEISDLKIQAANADVPTALLTQLDDLATRAAALGASLQALVPATPAPPPPPPAS